MNNFSYSLVVMHLDDNNRLSILCFWQLILSCFMGVYCLIASCMVVLYPNSVEQDDMAHYVASHHGLHCLLILIKPIFKDIK